MLIDGKPVVKGEMLYRCCGTKLTADESERVEILNLELVFDVQEVPAAIKTIVGFRGKWWPAKDFRRTKPEKKK